MRKAFASGVFHMVSSVWRCQQDLLPVEMPATRAAMQSLPPSAFTDRQYDFRQYQTAPTKWFLAMHLLSQTKTGLSAMELHIPVENEHLFRFKMNADSGLRVHRFGHLSARTLMSDEPSCSNVLGSTTAALLIAAGLFSESKRCLPSKLSFCSKNPLSAYFPEMVFTDSGITVQLHPEYAGAKSASWASNMTPPGCSKHKLLQSHEKSDDKQPISGIIQLDDVYWGGERRGGKRGRGAAGKTPFVAAVALNKGRASNQDADDGGRWFQNQVDCGLGKRHVASGSAVISDGLACFRAVKEANW